MSTGAGSADKVKKEEPEAEAGSAAGAKRKRQQISLVEYFSKRKKLTSASTPEASEGNFQCFNFVKVDIKTNFLWSWLMQL